MAAGDLTKGLEMKICEIEESALRANKPIPLFTVDGVEYKTPLLAIAKAEDWMVLAARVENLDRQMQNAAITGADSLEVRREFMRSLADAVFQYNPEALPREKLENSVTPAQLMSAFWMLRTLSDPFDFSQAMTMAVGAEQMAALPKGAIEMGLSRMQKRQES